MTAVEQRPDLRRELRVYWQFARTGYRRESRYLLAVAGGLAANCVFGLIKASVLGATVTAAGGSVAGYTAATMGAYVWLSQALLGVMVLFGSAEVGERIKTGDIAVDFLRPVDLQLAHLATDLGRGVFTLLPRGVPILLIGALTFGFGMPATAVPYLLGAASVLLGIAVSFLCRFTVNLLGLWLVDTRGPQTVYTVVCGFLAGLFVPVPLFPGWLTVIAHATPFPSILQTPIDVLSGRVVGLDAAWAVAVQLGWALAIGALGQLTLRRGRRKLEVQGG